MTQKKATQAMEAMAEAMQKQRKQWGQTRLLFIIK